MRRLGHLMAAMTVASGCGGGEETTTRAVLDDEVCLYVDVSEACPSVKDAKQQLEGIRLCTDPVEEVVEVGGFLERREGSSGSDTAALDACCYRAANEVIPGGACVP